MRDFEYAAPRSEGEALALLSEENCTTEILAGGTDLVGLMKKMVVTPDRIVNIMEVPAFKQIGPSADGGLMIGATVTLDEVLEYPYLEHYPAITQAIQGINSMQLQCQGTIGGEICQRAARCWYFRNGHGLLGANATAGDNRFHAIFDNAGDATYVSGSRIAPALIALDASVRIVGPGEEERVLPVAEFFHIPRHDGQRETVLEPGQLVSHILLPPVDRNSATYEVRHGAGPDYPLAAAAASLKFAAGVVREAHVVLGQVAPVPWIADEAAEMLIGLPVDEAIAEAAGQAAVARATPLSGNEYKVQLAKVAAKRAILLAAGYDTGGF